MTDPPNTEGTGGSHMPDDHPASAVLAMLDHLPDDWDGPDSPMPSEDCRDRALEVERRLAGTVGPLRVQPMPVGGISITWETEGTRTVVNIENDDPAIETYTTPADGGGIRDYRECEI